MNILDAILDVFSSVGTWISESITSLMPIFYGESGLTFLGVLAVASLAFSVVFLILGGGEDFFLDSVRLSMISANKAQILNFVETQNVAYQEKNPRSHSKLPPLQRLRSSTTTPLSIAWG